MKRLLPSLLVCLALIPVARPAAAAQGTDAASAASTKAPASACELLAADDIEAVQGERPREAKPGSAVQDGLLVSQCYFALPTPAKSVSVTLTLRGEGRTARDPRASWKQTFHAGPEQHREERGEEADEPAGALTKVAGVGDEAFWAASPVGGSLYVLKRNRFVRISVGGPGDQAVKIGKCKKLARSILKRLP